MPSRSGVSLTRVTRLGHREPVPCCFSRSSTESAMGLLEDEDVAEMARVIGHVFSRSDPLGVAIGMTAEDIEAFILVFGVRRRPKGWTVIARGAFGSVGRSDVLRRLRNTTARPRRSPRELRPRRCSPGTPGRRLPTDSVHRRGQPCSLQHAGRRAHALGTGIAQKLVRARHGERRPTRIPVRVHRGQRSVSQHIFRKLGFQERHVVAYADFHFEGRTRLRGNRIEREGSC